MNTQFASKPNPNNEHSSNQPLTAGQVQRSENHPGIFENAYIFTMTLSANDNWPDLLEFLKQDNFPISPQDHESPAVLVRENPVLAAFYFERKLKALLKHVLLGKTTALGKIIDYFARVEFQNRGSPHMHMFLWVMDGPHIKSADHDTIVSFIDKHMYVLYQLK